MNIGRSIHPAFQRKAAPPPRPEGSKPKPGPASGAAALGEPALPPLHVTQVCMARVPVSLHPDICFGDMVVRHAFTAMEVCWLCQRLSSDPAYVKERHELKGHVATSMQMYHLYEPKKPDDVWHVLCPGHCKCTIIAHSIHKGVQGVRNQVRH